MEEGDRGEEIVPIALVSMLIGSEYLFCPSGQVVYDARSNVAVRQDEVRAATLEHQRTAQRQGQGGYQRFLVSTHGYFISTPSAVTILLCTRN